MVQLSQRGSVGCSGALSTVEFLWRCWRDPWHATCFLSRCCWSGYLSCLRIWGQVHAPVQGLTRARVKRFRLVQLKCWRTAPPHQRSRGLFFNFFKLLNCVHIHYVHWSLECASPSCDLKPFSNRGWNVYCSLERKTLSGGSLGSCVDEERSQLCELMWIAGRFEHRLLERTLRLRVLSWPRLAEGRLPTYRRLN